MQFTAPKFLKPMDFTTAIFSFFGWGAHHKVAQFVAVYMNATLDDATKIKIAEGLGYTKVPDAYTGPNETQRKNMSGLDDNLIVSLIETCENVLTRELERLEDANAAVAQAKKDINMLRAELKIRKENPNV